MAQIRAAQLSALADPRITLWAELAVLAHLTGWPVPRPARAFSAELHDMDPRTRDCAIVHAISEAVAARVSAISSRVSSSELVAHVAAALRQRITYGTRSCAREEPQFLAPPWKWALIRDALVTARRNGAPGRHPDSAAWERTSGQDIAGRDCAAQLQSVQRLHARAQRDLRAVTAVIWGTRPHTGIEQAIGTRAGSDDWTDRLTDALTAFASAAWPRDLLPARRSRP